VYHGFFPHGKQINGGLPAEKPFDAARGDGYLAVVNRNLNLNLLLNALLCRAAVGF
jgi:hypothetical protein